MPIAGVGEIVIKIAACGLCHTDLHYIDHDVPTFKRPPLVLGHEASGTVAQVGPGIDRWHEGDRVLVPALLTCGACDACRRGRENICERGIMPGNHIDGAYAEYMRVPEKDALPLPDDLPLQDACLIADAVSTPYHAVVNRGEVRPGQRPDIGRRQVGIADRRIDLVRGHRRDERVVCGEHRDLLAAFLLLVECVDGDRHVSLRFLRRIGIEHAQHGAPHDK